MSLVVGLLALTMSTQTPPVSHLTPPDTRLVIAMTLGPLLSEPGQPPRLVVSVRNTTKKPIPFMRFTRADCFAFHSLSGSLTTPHGKVTLDVDCPIRKWPGAKGTLEPGAIEERTLELRDLFPNEPWKAGAYELDVEWDTARLKGVFDGTYAVEASATSYSGTDFTLAPALAKVRLERGKQQKLPDGARITFTAHGHRDVAPGQESSLLVAGTFAAPGQKEPADFNLSVSPQSGLMPIGEFSFAVGEVEYGQSMDVRYFGKLPKR